MNSFTKTKVMTFEPGMYLFTYVKAAVPAAPSVVTFSKQPSKDSGNVHFLCSDPEHEDQLYGPSDYLVVRVSVNTIKLRMDIYNEQQGINPDVSIKIDQIGKNAARLKQQAQNNGLLKPDTQKTVQKVYLSGHLQWQGNIEVSQEQWLGKAEGGKNRLEAFCVHWPDKPKGINIKYKCWVKGFGELDYVKTGKTVGTWQKALPILAVAFKLIGKKSAQYQLNIKAAFSQTGIQNAAADDQVIKGLHTDEYLTGLHIEVIRQKGAKVQDISSPFVTPALAAEKTSKSWSDFDEVMVFKAD